MWEIIYNWSLAQHRCSLNAGPHKQDPRFLSAMPLCECKGIKILNSATRNKNEVISEIIQMLLRRGSHLGVSVITALPITFKCGPQSKRRANVLSVGSQARQGAAGFPRPFAYLCPVGSVPRRPLGRSCPVTWWPA